MYFVMNKCVTTVKVSNSSGHFLRNRSTLDIGVLGYIGIVQHKEHSPEVFQIPPGTPCICTSTSKVAYFMIQKASPWQPFYTRAFIGSKFCPFLIHNISQIFLCHNMTNCTRFSSAARSCPSTRETKAAKLVCSDIHLFSKQIRILKNMLC